MMRRDQSGLTLVEIMVVMVIIAALAAVAFPFLDNVLQVMTSKGASEQVAGAIRLARQHAITRGNNHCIEFSASPSTQYQIRVAPDTTNCTGAVVDGLAWQTVGNGAAVTNPAPAPTLIFDPLGNRQLPPAGSGNTVFDVDTQPASCLSIITVTLYGGVRVSKC